ncbi:DUF6318 family protein [Aeromicrobium sp. Root495]|uniref:DUF6318 family protein n=1 Tax=Aeromicrobium sp. Root495 TaxID=1736550 RepID=UPI003FA43CB7
MLLLPFLAACGEPDVKEPTTSATPSTRSTPAPPPPTIPAQAKEDSPEGAAAFVAAWVRQFNHAASSGNTTGLRAISAGSCRTCSKYIRTIEGTYSSGGFYAGGAWTLSDFDVTTQGSVRTVFVRAQSVPGGAFRQSSGSQVVASSSVDAELVFDIVRIRGANRVERIGRSK